MLARDAGHSSRHCGSLDFEIAFDHKNGHIIVEVVAARRSSPNSSPNGFSASVTPSV
jgi:hypothetical protein